MANYNDEQDLKVSPSEDGVHSQERPVGAISSSTRPPILYSSPKAFALSFGARWKSLWTRQFILSLLAGQAVSLCITCTNVTTTELVKRGWTLSTTQGIML